MAGTVSARLRGALAVGLSLCVLYVALKGYSIAWENRTPSGDQTDYLGIGQDVAEGHGMGATSIRGPLLPYLLAPFASATPGYFAAAKILVVAISTVGIATLAWLAWRLECPWTAFWWISLLAHNVVFLWYSGRGYPEYLVGVLCALSFLLGPGARSDHGRGGRPALSGLFLGLAYLCKASVSLLVPATVFGWLAEPIPWARRWRRPALFAAVFALVISPLLVRNAGLFGNPLYTEHTGHVIWLESWDQVYSAQYLASEPTALSYLRNHTPGQILGREVAGMRRMVANFILALEVTLQPFVPGEVLPKIFAAGLLSLVALGILREKRRVAQVALASGFALFFLFFAWDSAVVNSPRFLVPIVPLLLLSGSRFLGEVSEARRRSAAIVAVLVAWTLIRIVVRVDWPSFARNFAELGALPASHAEMVKWIQTHDEPEDILCYGPEESLYPWITGRHPYHLLTESDPVGLRSYLAGKRVRYLILDLPSLVRRPYLQPYFEIGRDHGIDPLSDALNQDFPDWRLVFETVPEPNQFLVYRVAPPRG